MSSYYSITTATGTGAPQQVPTPPYLDRSHISVTVDGVFTSGYTWVNSQTVSLTAPVGAAIRVRRATSPTTRLVDFQGAVPLTESDLDTDSLQAFYLAQEAADVAADALEAAPAVADVPILQTWEFLATAGQSSMSVAPLTPQVTAVQVEVGGIALPPSSLSVVGSTVSFPPVTLGTQVVVRVYTRGVATLPPLTDAGVAPAAGIQATKLAYGSRSVSDKLGEFRSVTDNGADPTGVADSSMALSGFSGIAWIAPGTYRSTTAPTGPSRAIVIGAQFTGTAPYDAWLPAFGTSTMEVLSVGGQHNALIGAVRNTLPAGTLGFPTGVTGYARNDNAGNTAFGVYAEARQYASSGCVVGAELDSFNETGVAPTATTTPNRGIGTVQQLPNAVTIAAGGTANSWCGAHFTREGSSPQRFLYGTIYDADAHTESAIVIEASVGVGPALPLLVKHKASAIAAQFQGAGTPVGANSWLQYVDGAGTVQQAFKQDGSIHIRGSQVLTTRRTGWAAATGTAARSTFATSTVTVTQLAERVKALIDDLTTHGLIGT